MKKTYAIDFAINIVIILVFYLFLLLITSCTKESSPDHPPGTTGNDPETPTGNNSCTPVKADAENMAVFPIGNPWNQDISGSPVDPYNDGIIAQIANTGMHPDFGSGNWNGSPIGIPYVGVRQSTQNCCEVSRQ